MNHDEAQGRAFGCERCWPPSADAAWEARSQLIREVELIDESHFHVMILACLGCSQRFVSVFTETIDWADGDDPQYWMLLPITEAERSDLAQRRDSMAEAMLDGLGMGRRCLQYDHPKTSAPRCYWSTGIMVGPHD